MNDQAPPMDGRTAMKHERVQRALHRERIRGDWDDLFKEPCPEELGTPYVFDEEGERRNKVIMKKYADRRQNTRRAWNRMQRYMPELLNKDAEKQVVFELSTAHGAVLEVIRHFGHDVIGNDFANMVFAKKEQAVATTRALNDESFERDVDDWGYEITDDPSKQDWPYRHITEAIDLPMLTFDGGKIPYPLKDKSVDSTICLQAIEHYCHPDEWMTVVEEMCRFTRKSIFILLNPMHKRFKEVEGYEESYDRARRNLRSYNANGFVNVATHMHWGAPNGFKLMAL